VLKYGNAIYLYLNTNMSKVIFVSLLLLTKISFGQTSTTEPLFQNSSPEDSLSFYFPPILNDTAVGRTAMYQNYKQNWYSSTLYSFKEPILFNRKESNPIYRLLWLRSFDEPICFSLTMSNGKYYINAKKLDRAPSFYLTIEVNYDKDGNKILDTTEKADRLAYINLNKTIQIKEENWNYFKNVIKRMNFWELPPLDPGDEQPMDGSYWILEGIENDKYHFIDRRHLKELMECVRYLIRLSGLNIPERKIY
jgi:hypothetical protein